MVVFLLAHHEVGSTIERYQSVGKVNHHLRAAKLAGDIRSGFGQSMAHTMLVIIQDPLTPVTKSFVSYI